MNRRGFLKLLAVLPIAGCDRQSGQNPSSSGVRGEPISKFFVETRVSNVPLASDAITRLPDTFEITGGKYVFDGIGYDCSRPGLYRFYPGYGLTIHARLVHTGPLGGDLYSYLSGASWNHLHGVSDETDNLQALAEAGRTQKWRLRCGYTVNLMRWLLARHGYTTRTIALITLGPKNGVDDGHAVFEVFHEGKWKLWDITNGCYFQSNGVHLSAEEIIDLGVLNCDRVKIDADQKLSADTWAGWCFSCYGDMAMHNEQQQNAWFEKIYQHWEVG